MKLLPGVAFLLAVVATQTEKVTGQDIRPPSLDSLRVLGMDSVGGVATAYFRPGHQARAGELQLLLSDFLTFYREQAGVDSRMRIAVVDSTDWARLTGVPYGLPTNSGLGTGNLLLAAVTPPERVGARQLPRGRLMDFLTIGHEGGHLLTWELLPGPMKAALASSDPFSAETIDRFTMVGQIPAWYWEMVANYLTTAFLEDRNPDGGEAWLTHLRELTDIEHPRFTHLGDWFGRVMQATAPDSTPYVFSVEGGLNQGWYQGVVGQLAAHIYEEAGLGFVNHIRTIFELRSAPATSALVDQLEAIAPGVADLLRDLGAEWRN